jgi:hypothetical protein
MNMDCKEGRKDPGVFYPSLASQSFFHSHVFKPFEFKYTHIVQKCKEFF